MYNDEFNNNDMYRFTNREVPRDDYAPAPRQENTYTAPVKKQGFFRRTLSDGIAVSGSVRCIRHRDNPE